MTTSSSPRLTSADQPPAQQQGPLKRIMVGSLLAGLVAAAVLVFVVLPGAREYVTTGSIMLAFAAGWAMLAVLTTRLTSAPQRWAFVPAAAMGITGVGLLAFAPGDAGLRTASWFWPPVLLALAAWMTVQVRRGLPGRTRWLLYPVVAVLALAAVGGLLESVSRRADERRFAMPGHLYDVGGHRLHLNCTGTGSPVVVLESGLGESSPQWARITGAVSGTTRICAYDRAGQGWSEDAPHPQDSLAVAKDLHTLLAAAGEQGPFVLAAHSVGGAYAMTFAARYPAEVAGMVLLDSSSPRQFSVLPDYKMEYALIRRLYGVAPLLARLGVARVIKPLAASNVPGEAGREARAFAASPRSAQAARDEVSVYHAAFEQARALTSLGNKPLVVLTATDSLAKTRGWKEAQRQLALLSTNHSARVTDSSHGGLLEDAPAFRASAQAITDVVNAIRNGTSLAAR